MMNIETLTVFLGWCSVINIGMLTITAILLIIMKGPISHLHSKMFGVSETEIISEYFKYLGNYKIGIIIFNIVPYIALKIMVS